MVRRAHRGGIGAIGSAMARMLHPSWRPVKSRHHVTDTRIPGEGQRRVGQDRGSRTAEQLARFQP